MATSKYAGRANNPKAFRTAFQGIPLTIDRPRGYVQSGVDPDGQPWSRTYAVDYGYIPKTNGGDDEGLDVFVGPNADSEIVFWARQNGFDGLFDEYKLFLGYDSASQVQAEFERHIPIRLLDGVRKGNIQHVKALLGLLPRESEARVIDQLGLQQVNARLAMANLEVAAALVACDLGVNDVNQNSASVRMVPTRTPGSYQELMNGAPTINLFIPPVDETGKAKLTSIADRSSAGNVVSQPDPQARPAVIPMSELSTKKREGLKPEQFALPEDRAYPIHDAAHVRNAAARLAQAKKAGRISPSKYAKAKAAINRAEKRFGIKSAAKPSDSKRPGVRIRGHLGVGGELHVRHMSSVAVGGELVTCRTYTPIGEADVAGEGKPVWIQLAKAGMYRGHKAGVFQLNARVFDEVIANRRTLTRGDVPFDFEHASEQPPAEGDIATEGAPAQGWIKDLKHDGQALFALVEWLEPARTYIKQKKYRFVSPAIRFGVKHPESGENVGAVLTSAALTNVPFLTGMQPIAASLAGGRAIDLEEVSVSDSIEGAAHAAMKLAHSPDEYMGRVKACLGLHDLASASDCREKLMALRDHYEADRDGDADGMNEGVKLSNYLGPMRDLTMAAPGTTWEQVFDTVQDLIDAAIDQHVLEDHGGDPDAEEATMTLQPDDGSPVVEPQPPQHQEPNDMATTPDTVSLDKVTMNLREAETKNGELNVQLSQAQAANQALTTEKTTLASKVDELTLRLAAFEAEKVELSAKLATAEATLQEIKTKAIESKVDYAIKAYGASKGVKAEHRAALMSFASSSPAEFDQLYPPGDPGKEHLLMNLTGGATEKTASVDKPITDGPKVIAMSLADVATQIAAQKGISYEEAISVASRAASSASR